jgi:hypothetical protein
MWATSSPPTSSNSSAEPGHTSPPRESRVRGMTNKTPREEAIQKEQEAKDAEKERLEEEEERRQS